MPTYYLAGVMYINGCEGNDQRVLIPDGRNDSKIQLPLKASILVAKADWQGDTFGTEAQDRGLTVDGQSKEFRECFLTKRSRISVPHAGGAQCLKLDTGLPRAQNAGFNPDLVTPDTVAEIELNGGTVTARSLAGVPIVEWLPGKRNDGLREEEPITITATLLDEQRQPTAVTQTLTVSHDAAVVFVHSNDLFAVPDDGDKQPGSSFDSSSSSTSSSSSDSEPKERPQSRRTILDRATLYTKISHQRTPVDPDELAKNYDPEDPQPNIPSTDQADVVKALPERPGWRTSDVPWCCAK
jgi:hypothetical protein